MKQFVTLLIMILCSTFTANAQNYLDHLKKKEPGKGVVTVNQSKAIDELVNGKQVIPQDDKTKTTPQKKEKEPETQHKQGPDSLKKAEPQHREATRENAHVNNAQKAENKNEETETPVVDMRKKVMRKSYKVTGYRVQAFAGGNSRNDRLKAEQTGNQLKVHFPEQPVYVHFYSPRWICRIWPAVGLCCAMGYERTRDSQSDSGHDFSLWLDRAAPRRFCGGASCYGRSVPVGCITDTWENPCHWRWGH